MFLTGIMFMLNLLKTISRLFLVEATVTHKGQPKPLLWDRLKFSSRFAFANSSKVKIYLIKCAHNLYYKVDHIVVDDQLKNTFAKKIEW